MRITTTGPPLATSSRRDSGAATAKVAFQPLGAAAQSSIGLGGMGSLTSLDALLAVQAPPDSLDRRRRARQHADRTLDDLEALQIALLDGMVPADLMSQLRTRIERGEVVDDPQLAGIITAIEQRAAVELAKLENLTRSLAAAPD